MTKRTFCAVLLLAVLVNFTPVFNSSGPAEESKTDSSLKVVKKTDKKPPFISDETPIGKTVKLTITLTNDDGDHDFLVTCAGRNFHIEHDITEVDGGHQVKILGYLKPVDQEDRIFVRFELENYHTNDKEGVSATFHLKGSAILKFGKKIDIGTLGDQKATVLAELVE